MNPDVILSVIGLAIAAAWTPGPNNAMVASSGATYGFRATLPHIAGIGIGFPVMIFCIAVGLGEIFERFALVREGLRALGIIALIWVAYKIATSKAPGEADGSSRPFRFYESAAFQWVNPKAWVMAVSVTAQYAGGKDPILKALIISSIFVCVGFGSATTWTLFGAAMQRWLKNPRNLRIFNYSMAAMILSGIALIAKADLS